MTAGRGLPAGRVVLLILVMVAGVVAFAPRAFAQTTPNPGDRWTPGGIWNHDVTTTSLIGKLMLQQSFTIDRLAGTKTWANAAIDACPWTKVTLPLPSTSCTTFKGYEASSSSFRNRPLTVANFVPTQAMIDNGGVVIRLRWKNYNSPAGENVAMTEWVPLLPPPSATLVLTPTSISENGGVATVSATLDRQWSDVVTITVSASAMAPAVTTDFTRSGMTLTFAANATTSTGTVTLTAMDNAVDAPPKSVTVSGTASDSVTNAPPNVTLTITDDDVAGLVVSPATSSSSRLRTTEDRGTDTFTVKLATEPTGDVVLGVASSSTAEGTVLPSSLTFTATTWNTEQTVTLTGVDDAPTNLADGDQDYTVTLTVNTGDTNYNALSAVTVYAVNADNEYGLNVGTVTGQATEVGGMSTFTVALNTQPLQAVTVSVTSRDPSEGRASPSSLTFTDSTWNTKQTVTVTGADDAIDDGDVTWDVRLVPSSADGNYGGLSPVDVSVTTTDDEGTPTVTLAVTPVAITEAGGVATVTATLSGKSSQAVTLTVATGPVSPDFTQSGTTLTILAEQTTSTGLVTVTAVDNDVDAADKAVTISATATGGNNVAAPSSVTLTVTDDDTLGLEIAPTALALEETTTDPTTHMKTYTVKLATQPTAAVTVTVTMTVVDGDTGVEVDPTTLSFMTTDWATAQPVTVTAVVDAGDYRNEKVRLTHTVSSLDTSYASLSAVTVTVTVDDTDPLPTLGPGEDTTINGHPVTVTSTGETPAVTVTPPADLNGALTVAITPAGETVPRASTRFALGAEATHRTVVDIAVSGAGRATVRIAGLEICLPVSAALLEEADAFDRPLQFLHYQEGAWTEVENPAYRDGQLLCARVRTFSPFAVGYQDEKPRFAKDAGQPRVYYTGTEVRDNLRAVVSGDSPISYTLTPATLPAGLTYTPPGDGASHGGTITGTPTTLTALREYTLTAMDVDRDTGSTTFTIEVAPFTLQDKVEDPPIRVNGFTMTVVRARETPAAVTVTPTDTLKATLAGDLEVVIQRVTATGPREESPRFTLGADVTVDIAVSGAGLPSVQTAGLEICLPVSAALLEEADAFDRPLQFLHYKKGAWTIVAEYDRQTPGMICGTVKEFSPFAVGYRDEKPRFPEDMKSRQLLFHTGREESNKLPAVVSGDTPISYTLTDKDGNVAKLPAGLTYTLPGDKLGSEHDGTITGTPTTPTAQEETYTLTATDGDGDTNSMTLRIEVKPGIQSRDLGLVLAGVGRTLASDAVEILGGRFGSSPASRLQVTLGGQVLRLTNPPASPSPSSPPSPLAGEGRGEGGVLQGEGSVLQGEASAVPVGSSPWQQATGLALSVARALGVNLDTSPSPLAGEGRGEGGILQNEPNLPGRLPTDLRRSTTSSPFRLQSVSGKDLLARSAFELPLTRTGDAGVPAWTLWGRGSAAGFSGQPEAGFTMDGTLYSGYVGVDYRPQATMLLGLALAHSTGEVNYERTGATKAGADVELTSVLPYAHWQPRPGLGVWGLAGVGWGEMDLKLVGDPQMYTTGLTSWLGAVGGRQALTTWQGIDLAAKTDAFLTTVRSAGKTNLPAARGHAQRVRLLVEGRTAVEVSSVSRLEPRLELGGRWDNGTAEQGLGAELGGGVAYTRTDWGLSVDAQGRYLLLHEDGAFEDWGASMSVRLDPGVAGEGAYLTVAPVWGQASSGVDQLWSPATALSQTSGTSRPATGWQPHRLEVDLGYGVALADGRGLVTPYGGLALAGPGSSRYRLGSRLALSSSLDVTLEGERAEQPGQKTAHGVSVRLGSQW